MVLSGNAAIRVPKWLEFTRKRSDTPQCMMKAARSVVKTGLSESERGENGRRRCCCLIEQFKSVGGKAKTTAQTAHLTAAYVLYRKNNSMGMLFSIAVLVMFPIMFRFAIT